MNRESWARIRAVLWKEWRELRNNRAVVAPTLLLPSILTAVATISLHVMSAHMDEVQSGLKGLDPNSFLIQVGRQMVTLFLIMPCVLPSTTAAHSIIGEKVARSLEPVLATPVRTFELLAGKMAACVLLGVLPAWVCYAVFLGYLRNRLPPGVFPHLVSSTQVVMVLLIGPLLALLSVSITTMISSRINEVQAAQSISVLVTLPVIGLATSQAAGLVTLALPAVLASAAALVIVDVAAVSLCVSLFDRETILTRWK
jgi:ABC-2 type transport system permease protein